MVNLENTAPARVTGRRTAQRAEVQQALIQHSDGFVSAQALHAAMVAGGSRVGLTTVYRALATLAETGRADIVREPSGERLYRHRPGGEHRHYLICRSCGRSEPLDTVVVEDWAGRLAGDTGYADLHHTLELSGICGRCDGTSRDLSSVPLTPCGGEAVAQPERQPGDQRTEPRVAAVLLTPCGGEAVAQPERQPGDQRTEPRVAAQQIARPGIAAGQRLDDELRGTLRGQAALG